MHCNRKINRAENPVIVNKIFRPWDVQTVENDSFQDATVSTTSENFICDQTPPIEKPPLMMDLIKSVEQRPKTTKEIHFTHQVLPAVTERVPPFPEFPPFPDGPSHLYPELQHLNIAQSLGLTPSDPLIMEYLNHGCSLDEYARVLNQEHQTKAFNARKQRPKKYRCPHCDVGFSNNGQLKGHIRIHTGERPFRCEEKNCGKTFTRNEELTRHKRIHSGLRPFPCQHCGKRFGRKDHLKKHSRTHFQPRGVYAVPVMLPYEAWASGSVSPFLPMLNY